MSDRENKGKSEKKTNATQQEVRRREIPQHPIDQDHLMLAIKFATREIKSNRMLPAYLDDALVRFLEQCNRELQPFLVKTLVNKAEQDGFSLSRTPRRGADETAFTKVAKILDLTPEAIEKMYYKDYTKTDT